MEQLTAHSRESLSDREARLSDSDNSRESFSERETRPSDSDHDMEVDSDHAEVMILNTLYILSCNIFLELYSLNIHEISRVMLMEKTVVVRVENTVVMKPQSAQLLLYLHLQCTSLAHHLKLLRAFY